MSALFGSTAQVTYFIKSSVSAHSKEVIKFLLQNSTGLKFIVQKNGNSFQNISKYSKLVHTLVNTVISKIQHFKSYYLSCNFYKI